MNNCESIFRSNKEKTELSNIDVLDALCSTIPTADSFGLSDKPLRLVDYFVSPDFTKGGEKIYQLQDVINSAFDSETNNQITFLVGDPGSGNASALNAIVLSYVQNKKEKRILRNGQALLRLFLRVPLCLI